MKKTVFILLIALFGLASCATIDDMTGNNSSESVQTKADTSHQSQAQDQNRLNAKLLRENGELNIKLKEANNRITGLQTQVQSLSARLEQQKAAAAEKNRLAGAADVDLDVYATGVSETDASQIENAMKLRGFQPHYSTLPKTMTMSKATTVYYYDSKYIPVAGALAQDLANALNHKVVTRKGASSFPKNKIIVHMRGR